MKITRHIVRSNPDKTFLYGDNLQQCGMGGQASSMRGEKNAIGIPTKKKPSMTLDSFFTDEEFENNKKAIDKAFSLIPEYRHYVIVPRAGLGTGLAQLKWRAPRTFAYINFKLAEVHAERW